MMYRRAYLTRVVTDVVGLQRGRIDSDVGVDASSTFVPRVENVALFDRNTFALVDRTISKPDGSYSFKALIVDREYFVLATDSDRHYNAVVKDMIVPTVY